MKLYVIVRRMNRASYRIDIIFSHLTNNNSRYFSNKNRQPSFLRNVTVTLKDERKRRIYLACLRHEPFVATCVFFHPSERPESVGLRAEHRLRTKEERANSGRDRKRSMRRKKRVNLLRWSHIRSSPSLAWSVFRIPLCRWTFPTRFGCLSARVL